MNSRRWSHRSVAGEKVLVLAALAALASCTKPPVAPPRAAPTAALLPVAPTPPQPAEPALVEPPAAPATIQITIDATAPGHPIAPLIYGMNVGTMRPAEVEGLVREVGITVARAGGNRFSAYNWETNASNAGSDWQFFNDGYLSGSDEPCDAIRGLLEAAEQGSLHALLTTQLGDYVSADKQGNDVRKTAKFLETRFHRNQFRKPGPLNLVPDTEDKVVYQDEFLNWVRQKYPHGKWLVTLDNEADLWPHTHVILWPKRPDYAEVVRRNVEAAKAVRFALPEAEILGFASYGWNGWRTLQGHADEKRKGEFLNYYLAEMKKASDAANQRLIDYVDLHWYPEARGDGERVTTAAVTPGAVEARVQAPRSLWDEQYVETSWITENLKEPIRLLPRLKAQLAQHFPGTKLAIAEWSYGAGQHISGGVATADVLGVYGREGVGMASLWHAGNDQAFTYGGFQIYRNYDGQGGKFGDQSVPAQTSDHVKTSVYAALDSQHPEHMTIVAINKTTTPQVTGLKLAHAVAYRSARVYVLRAESFDPARQTARPERRPSLRAVGPNDFKIELPPLSVTLLIPSPEAAVTPGPRWPAPVALSPEREATFERDVENWTLKSSSPAELTAQSRLAWTATEGDPKPGALMIEVPFSAREQQVQLVPPASRLDLKGKRLDVRVRREGAFDGGIMVFMMSGGDYVWVAHGWTTLSDETWHTISVDPAALAAKNPKFNPADVREYGIMFNTGAGGAGTPGPVKFYVDTVVVQGPVGG